MRGVVGAMGRVGQRLHGMGCRDGGVQLLLEELLHGEGRHRDGALLHSGELI